MLMVRRINANGLDLLKRWEAFIPFAYDDFDPPKTRRKIKPGDKVNGTLTVGYGSTGAHVKPGMTITEAEASDMLLADLDRFERAVDRKVIVPLTDNQFAALVSFCFNVGEGNFGSSTLLKKLNRGDYASVPSELAKWVTSKGKRMQGLVNRRAAEAGLWAKGAFVSGNTIDARPAKVSLLTVDNVVKVATPASALLQSFTSGPAQIVLAAAFALGALFLMWQFASKRREASS
jgi:lysozyme